MELKTASQAPGVRQSGLTLLEVLVVMVLTGLIATLVMQAVSFSLTSFQKSKAVQQGYQRELLGLSWLRGSLENLLAAHDEGFATRGSQRTLTGYTLSPLFARSGSLARVRWTIRTGIRTGAEEVALWYEEDNSTPYRVISFPFSEGRFIYLDGEGAWVDDWPPEEVRPGTLPKEIRLQLRGETVDGDRSILMASRLRTRAAPDYRDLL